VEYIVMWNVSVMPMVLHLCYILSCLCGCMAMWDTFALPEHIHDNRFLLYDRK